MMLVQYPDNKFDETSVPWHLRIFHREARLVATMSDMLSNLVINRSHYLVPDPLFGGGLLRFDSRQAIDIL